MSFKTNLKSLESYEDPQPGRWWARCPCRIHRQPSIAFLWWFEHQDKQYVWEEFRLSQLLGCCIRVQHPQEGPHQLVPEAPAPIAQRGPAGLHTTTYRNGSVCIASQSCSASAQCWDRIRSYALQHPSVHHPQNRWRGAYSSASWECGVSGRWFRPWCTLCGSDFRHKQICPHQFWRRHAPRSWAGCNRGTALARKLERHLDGTQANLIYNLKWFLKKCPK